MEKRQSNAKITELYTITEIGGLYKFLEYMKVKFEMYDDIYLEIEVEKCRKNKC